MTDSGRTGLFAGLFDRGAAPTGDAAWLQAMLDAEAALARALERAGLASAGAGGAVTAAARADQFDPAELGRQAVLTGNPVPALVRALSAKLPPDAREAVHRGATSQDIIDTAAMLIARRALDAILADLQAAADSTAGLAQRHAQTVMAGRTLLQQAVPVTFGLVAAGWLISIDDARSELGRVRDTGLAIQYGGAAGTLASLGPAGPAVTALFAAETGLPEPVLPWHTDRQRILRLAAALTGACAALGKIARDVTLLAQTEIGEVAEGAGEPGRGGSSAMPQKRNPVASVLILGCVRRAPGLLATLAAAAEHELQRAAGAWHAEWEPLSDLLRLTGSAAVLGGRAAGGPARGRGPDAGQPGRGRRAAAGRARRGCARPAARPAGGARPGQGRGSGRGGGRPEPAGRDAGRSEHQREARQRGGHARRAGGRRRPGRLSGNGCGVRPPCPDRTSQPGRSRRDACAMNDEERSAAGMRTRREVLGDAHVDRAVAGTTEFTAPFQDFITRYAWGEVWNRPGLTRPERSMITLAMLAALGRDEELAMHVRAARRNGLTQAQIAEVLLQVAVYAGVPAANRAFAVARAVLEELS